MAEGGGGEHETDCSGSDAGSVQLEHGRVRVRDEERGVSEGRQSPTQVSRGVSTV